MDPKPLTKILQTELGVNTLIKLVATMCIGMGQGIATIYERV